VKVTAIAQIPAGGVRRSATGECARAEREPAWRPAPIAGPVRLSTWQLVLAATGAFFANWGPAVEIGMVQISPAKLFWLSAIPLIVLWFWLGRDRFGAFPWLWNAFFALVVVHSLITFGVFHREELSFASTGQTEIDETTVEIEEARGIYVARYFLYAVYAYALACVLRGRRELMIVSLASGAGLLAAMVLGNRESIAYSEGVYRSTGGFLNPNDLGNTAMTVVMLNLCVLRQRQARLGLRLLGAVFVCGGLYGLLASASRSALLALCVAVAVVLTHLSTSNKLRVAVILVASVAALVMYLPREVFEALETRVNIETVLDTRGSMRLDIYADYLCQFPRYALTGVGLKRSLEVTKDSYTTLTPLIPHNGYLEVLVEFGCPGLLLFLGALLQFRRGLAVTDFDSEDAGADSVIQGLFWGWTAYLVVASAGSRIFWITWAVLGAYQAMRQREQAETCQQDEMATFVPAAITGAAAR
jgi:O-antigen ligase